MKNRTIQCLIVSGILFTCGVKVTAQDFEIGFRYEPEFSILMNKNDADAGPALNDASHFTYFNFGIGAVYTFNNNVGLAADILFSREGQNFTGNFDGTSPNSATYSKVVSTQAYLNNMVILGNYVAKSELNFIKLPVMLSLMSNNTKPLFFTFLFGPQVNFLYNVAQEINHTDKDYPNSNITTFDLYKPITIDGIVAIGAGYSLTPHLILSARLRFDYGFEDIENKDVMVSYYNTTSVSFYSPERQATHNATAGILIGLDFKL